MFSLRKKFFAEFLGTFVLVFFACGTAVVTDANVVATALAFGLSIVAMAYSIGNISGCHVNPAVSIAMLVSKKMTLKEFLVYIGAQFLGAIIGAGILYGLILGTGHDITTWATNAIVGSRGTTYSAGQAFASLGIEVVLTFIFVYVILGALGDKKMHHMEGLIIGLTLTLIHLVGINLTGTSVNPARSFGPALMRLCCGGGVDALAQYWVFLVAPLIGGVLAAIAYKFLNRETAMLDGSAVSSDNITTNNDDSSENLD